jgi:ABC-type transport system involved in cytochrome bd biosynthesis fused ATPase/permease subunit
MYISSLDRIKGIRTDLTFDNNLALDMIGGEMVAMAAHFAIGVVLIAVLESGISGCIANLVCKMRAKNRGGSGVRATERKGEEDLDVKKEAERVLVDCPPVAVSNFRKIYPSFFGTPTLAVNNISFGLSYGDSFALLGVNGAGKTTTFKALTQPDRFHTSGTIQLNQLDLTTTTASNFNSIRRLIGYCP